MKFIVFVSAVLAIATSAKAGVMRTPEDTRPVVIGDGSSTPRHEIAGPSTPFTGVAGASTPLIDVPTVEDIPEVVEIAGVPKVVQIDEEPTHLEDVDADGGVPADPKKEIIRERRLTCDLFSFSSSVVTPNHAACATKCIGMGRKGGHCDGTTCNCRGDKWIG